MSKYILIRADDKSISPPMSKHEAIMKLREYNKKCIVTYVVSKNKHLNINYSSNSNKSLN